VRWTDDRRLIVEHDPAARVFLRRTEIGPVQVGSAEISRD
jgi:hypothetical protein